MELSRCLYRPPLPEDVAHLLCKPKLGELPAESTLKNRIILAALRKKKLFIKMVETTMSKKEDLERKRQAELAVTGN